jgi:predicted nucleotidyltransferase
LTPEAEHALSDAARAWPALELLIVFGSAACERMTERSDVDLLVRVEHGKPVDRGDRERFLAEASRACRREIDPVIE